ncbi:MAG: dTMP kinase [Nitrospira sp.]|nr:dTMP kinase [bacterium]MBL7048447.1 dTMP kinase [Nitrospira sp.]
MSGGNGFISFEGIEGSGKSTQSRVLAEYLRSKGRQVVETAEPGGTDTGSKIRKLLLEPGNVIDPLAELLLYYASRAQLLKEVILPALQNNQVVITDRFTDSTVAYQGYARGIDLNVINTLNNLVVPDTMPQLTILLDFDVEEGLSRNRKAMKEDRFELEAVEFHRRVRNGFQKIAEQEPDRVKIVDASQSPDAVSRRIIEIVDELWH